MIVPADSCPSIDAPKIFLEVGCNYGSVPASGDYQFAEDEQYVGINIDHAALVLAESEIARADRLKREPLLIKGDAIALPLQIQNSSVDTIYFGNVFGDPGIDSDHIARLKSLRFADWQERSNSWSPRFERNAQYEPITPKDLITLPGMLREAHRVIKESGRLVVVETLTPYMDPYMEAFMNEGGFAVDRHVRRTPDEMDDWIDLVRPYKRYEAKRTPDIELSEPSPPNYILFASKLAIAKAA